MRNMACRSRADIYLARISIILISACLSLLCCALASSAKAQQSVAVCMSRETIAVAVSTSISPLGGEPPARSSVEPITGKLIADLRGFGGQATYLDAKLVRADWDGFGQLVDRSGGVGASLLILVQFNVQQQRINSSYIGGDPYPLRTVVIQPDFQIVDVASRELLTGLRWPAMRRAAGSVDEAISGWLNADFSAQLGQALRGACDQLINPRLRPASAAGNLGTVRRPPLRVIPVAELKEKVELYMRLCLATGKESKLEGGANAGVAVRLFDLGAEGKIERKEADSVLALLQNKLDGAQTVEEAKGMRECLKPVRDRVLQMMN